MKAFKLLIKEINYNIKLVLVLQILDKKYFREVKKYIEDKKDLEKKTFQLRDIEKEVRIINVYPNTLESSEKAPYQKLKFSEVSKIIKWVIETPQDIEIFQLGISKTKLKIDTNLI